MTVDEALAVLARLREVCLLPDGSSLADSAEPWGADCGLIYDAIAAIETLSELAEDAKRWEHARKLLTIDDIELAHEEWEAFGRLTSEYECLRADAAIDKAIAASGGDNQEQTK